MVIIFYYKICCKILQKEILFSDVGFHGWNNEVKYYYVQFAKLFECFKIGVFII
jgi:hypothetical protein